MTISELAECDRRERQRLHDKAIADVQHELEVNRARGGRTDALERHLARLCAQEMA